jgi:hypothetical protein
MESQHLGTQVPFPIDVQNDEVLGGQIPEPSNSSAGDYWAGKEMTAASGAMASPPGVTFNIDGGSLPTDANDVNATGPTSGLIPPPAESAQSDMDSLNALISAHGIDSTTDLPNHNVVQPEVIADLPLRRSHAQSQRQSHFSETPSTERERLEGKLRLQTLELERVPLSVAVLQKAFDWSVLTNLTILDCPQHEKLWYMLRRHFQPTPIGGSHTAKHGSSGSLQYHLNLKKIHTDAASPALINFLKETLAPNTLETLFLQDRKRSSISNVPIVRFSPKNTIFNVN